MMEWLVIAMWLLIGSVIGVFLSTLILRSAIKDIERRYHGD